MEWLAESGHLKVLCATTTIAQGIDFPVSSVFLASRHFPGAWGQVEMTPREFWNLAGRAGRLDHDSVGVVGLAEGTDRAETMAFVQKTTGVLVSRLVTLLDELAREGELAGLAGVLWKDQWEDFRCYVAHLCAEARSLDAVLADSEQLLRHTYGYATLRADPARRQQAEALLTATREYASACMDKRGVAQLADSTGFSPEGVSRAMGGLRELEDRLTPDDWMPDSLFGNEGRISDLFGVMLRVPQLKRQFADAVGASGGQGELSGIARDWVNGERLREIAVRYFGRRTDSGDTRAITEACRTIYRAIANGGAWGFSALGALAGAGEALDDDGRRRLSALPAMVYHGVRSEEGVLMRMNAVPRSVAVQVGDLYRQADGGAGRHYTIGHARAFLRDMDAAAWGRVRPTDAALSGGDYRRVWRILSGEEL
jgi:replicative superfamily II helicase